MELLVREVERHFAVEALLEKILLPEHQEGIVLVAAVEESDIKIREVCQRAGTSAAIDGAYYWSSFLESNGYVWCVIVFPPSYGIVVDRERYIGMPVRPVCP